MSARVSRAVFVGLREAVREMKRVLDAATLARDVRWAEPLGDRAVPKRGISPDFAALGVARRRVRLHVLYAQQC